MTLLEHLQELRSRLFWIIVAVGLAAVAGWYVFDPVVERLLRPACPYLQDPEDCRLIFTSPLEIFTLRLRIAVYIGFGLAFPVVLYHFWKFIAPGLRPQERRYSIPFVIFGMLLFVMGVTFAMYTIPQALRFLIGPVIAGDSVTPLLTAREYLGFVLRYLMAFGLAFELPLVLMFLALARVITSRQMAQYRRHVLVGLAVMASFLTPPDAYTLVIGTVVLYTLYEMCIWLARLLKR